MRPILLFAIAGGVGYVVDGAILLLMAPYLGPYAGRLVSFCVAVLATWLINRQLAFRGTRSKRALHRELLRYFIVSLGGGSVTLGVYALIVFIFSFSGLWLLVALAAGALAGLVVNFTLSRRFVFAGKD
jgi:putative flippase GtrA